METLVTSVHPFIPGDKVTVVASGVQCIVIDWEHPEFADFPCKWDDGILPLKTISNDTRTSPSYGAFPYYLNNIVRTQYNDKRTETEGDEGTQIATGDTSC